MIDPLGGDPSGWPTEYLASEADEVVRMRRPDWLADDLELFAGATYTVLGVFNAPGSQAPILESISPTSGSRTRTNTVRTAPRHGAQPGATWAASKDITVSFFLPRDQSRLLAQRHWSPLMEGVAQLGYWTKAHGWRIWSGRPAGMQLTRHPDGSHSGIGVFTAFDPIAYGLTAKSATVAAPASGASASVTLSNFGDTLAPWWVTFAGNPTGEIVLRTRNTQNNVTDWHYVRLASKESKFPLLPMLGVGSNQLSVWNLSQSSTANVTFWTRDAWA